jgi:hypothetical protein
VAQNNTTHKEEKNMLIKNLLASVVLFALAGSAWADLEPWDDYDISESVWSVTTVKVDSNMIDAYLEGLKKTWVPGNKISQDLGQIEEWSIYSSTLPASGDFNLMLVVKFSKTEDLAPNKAAYKKYMAKFTKKLDEETTEYSQKNYPEMREITGEYLMREITIK